MSWAVQALVLLRAFLAPIYHRVKGCQEGDIRYTPALVRFVIHYITTQLNKAPPLLAEFRPRLPGTGATDAGATNTQAGVG